MSIRPESRAKFEKQGVFLTRLTLQMGNMDGPSQQEAICWLAGDERTSNQRESVRYRWMFAVSIIAAVGAWIAAWPVVKEWLMK